MYRYVVVWLIFLGVGGYFQNNNGSKKKYIYFFCNVFLGLYRIKLSLKNNNNDNKKSDHKYKRCDLEPPIIIF